MALAVRVGAAHPDIATEAALKAAVLAAPSLGFSTGPSGTYLNELLMRWGVAEQVTPRIVVPPPGTPVGSLVARGEVALGFQQLSELITLPGIEVLGTLPPEVAYITTFSAGIAQVIAHDAARVQAVQSLLNFLASADVQLAADARREKIQNAAAASRCSGPGTARGGARVAHCELTLGGHTDWVGSFAVLEGGGLASGCWDGTVRVWK